MKLIRFGQEGHEKPGIIINDTWYDVSGIVADYNEAFFANNEIEKIIESKGFSKFFNLLFNFFWCWLGWLFIFHDS